MIFAIIFTILVKQTQKDLDSGPLCYRCVVLKTDSIEVQVSWTDNNFFGNTADTPNLLGTHPGQRKFGSPHGSKKIWPRWCEPTTSGIDLLMLYRLSYDASTVAIRGNLDCESRCMCNDIDISYKYTKKIIIITVSRVLRGSPPISASFLDSVKKIQDFRARLTSDCIASGFLRSETRNAW